MSYTNTAFNVGNSLQLLVQPTAASVTDPTPVVIMNNDPTNTVFIGGPNVTSANGIPVYKQTGISFRILNSDPIYAITAGPTVDTRVMIGRQ